jgi:hypothetical protein
MWWGSPLQVMKKLINFIFLINAERGITWEDRNRIERREDVKERQRVDIFNIQSGYKRGLDFQNDIEKSAVCLGLKTYIVDTEPFKTFVACESGDCCCASLLLDATSFQNGYLTTCGVFCIRRIKSVTAVQLAFHRNVTRNHPAEHRITPGIRHSSGKGAFTNARVLVGLLCLTLLWTMFGLASKWAHKNKSTERALSRSSLHNPA